jgi:hypothetical protein
VQTGHLAVSTRAHELVQHTHGVFWGSTNRACRSTETTPDPLSLTKQAHTRSDCFFSRIRSWRTRASKIKSQRRHNRARKLHPPGHKVSPRATPTPTLSVTRTRSPIRSNKNVLFCSSFSAPLLSPLSNFCHDTHTRSVWQSWRTVANRLVVQPLPASPARSPSCMFQLLLRMTLCWCCSAARDLMWAKRMCCLNCHSVCAHNHLPASQARRHAPQPRPPKQLTHSPTSTATTAVAPIAGLTAESEAKMAGKFNPELEVQAVC